MDRIRRPRIPDTEWEGHKVTIKRLYLDEKRRLEGIGGVMSIMSDRHDFYASKAQYETRFKRWGLRKNLKRNDWKVIGRIYRKRKAAGTPCEIYLDGDLVPEDKVQKEAARYRCASVSEHGDEEALPEGVTIRNATLANIDEVAVETCRTLLTLDEDDRAHLIPSDNDAMLCVSNMLGRSTEGDNLSRAVVSVGFRERHGDRPQSPSENGMSRIGTELALLHTAARTPETMGDDYFSSWDLDLTSLPRLPSRYPSPVFFDPGDWSFVDDTQVLEMLPHFTTDNSVPLQSAMIPTGTWSLIQGLSVSCTRTILNKEIARPGIARMMPLLSGEAQDSLQRNSSEQVIIKLIVQLCVNNFAGSEGDEYEVLFRQLEHFSMTQAKALMDAIPQPYATALQQSILTIAIRFGAVSIVKALIHSGLDLDATACHFAGAPLTPLQYACRCRHLETIRILLFATKDVNRSFGVSVIGHLIGSDMEGEKVFPQIVGEILHLLLQADVWLQPGDLNDVRFWKDDSLVLAFLRYGKIDKTVRSLFLRGPTCLHVIRHRNEEEAVKCLGVLLEQDCDSPEVTNPEFMGQCQAILSEALFCGYAKVVDYLLSAGVIPTVVSLAGAVRTNSTGLVNRFLAMGIDPNDRIILTRDLPDPELANGCASLREFSCTLPAGTDPIFLNGDLTYIKAYTTPLAEAIRWERQDVVSLFQRIGAFETISKPDTHAFEFRAALDGAIEASNVTLVTALLEALPSQERSQHLGNLSSCFSLATLTDQDQIVSSLLHAGLRPDGRSVCTAVAVRNRRHLRLFLDSGATSTGEALWLAVRWGIADVVKELIIAGSPIDQGHSALQVFRKNGSSMSLPTPWCTPLGEALKEGNHTVVQLLLENGADINFKYQDWSVLAMAVRTGNESMIRGMLACGADPDDPRALLEATGRSFSVIQTLMEAFTEAYPKGGKNFSTLALRQAIRKSDVAQASLFLRYAEINSLEMSYDDFEEAEYVRDKIHTPLGEAIFIRNALIIQILLGTGGDPNSTVTLQKRDPSMPSARRTALLEAISTKDLAIVQLVHGAGAAVNCAANLGIERTPLQLAAEVGSAEIVEYLIKHGANVNGAPCIFGGGTALQLAAIKGYVGIAEVLVKHGGDVNAARGRYQGRTAFEGAAEHGRLDMLLFLYHNGADLVSDGGEQVRRAVELAEKNGQLAAKSLVEQLAQSVARCPSLRLG